MDQDRPDEPDVVQRTTRWLSIALAVFCAILTVAILFIIGSRSDRANGEREDVSDDPSQVRFMRPGERPKEPALTSETIAAKGAEEATVLDMARRKLVELVGKQPSTWATATYDSEGRWIVNGSTPGRDGVGVLWTIRIRVDVVADQRVLNVTECIVDGVSYGN